MSDWFFGVTPGQLALLCGAFIFFYRCVQNLP